MNPKQDIELLKYLRSIAVSLKGIKETAEEIKLILEEEDLDDDDEENIEETEEQPEGEEAGAEEDGTKEN